MLLDKVGFGSLHLRLEEDDEDDDEDDHVPVDDVHVSRVVLGLLVTFVTWSDAALDLHRLLWQRLAQEVLNLHEEDALQGAWEEYEGCPDGLVHGVGTFDDQF